jgi:hypothetical protein
MLFRQNSEDVAPHELGHVFQLRHTGMFDTFNLMCGVQNTLEDKINTLFPTLCWPNTSLLLMPSQINRAKKAATNLATIEVIPP